MSAHSYTLVLLLVILLLLQITYIDARVLSRSIRAAAAPPMLRTRQAATPNFPADPPSCPKCADNYDNINSCAQAAPVLANFSMVIFNPGAFIDVIKCACTDTFQAAYPQCVDCFIRTNQTDFLSASSDELPDIISGIRSICAIESTLLGNVSVVNSEVPASVSNTAALPTDTGVLTSSAFHHHATAGLYMPVFIWIFGRISYLI